MRMRKDNKLNTTQNNRAHGASLLRRGIEMLTVFLGFLFGNSPARWEARSCFLSWVQTGQAERVI